ncbi:hypothetical protein [Pseudomonas frederiksbergensis]|nr:hypothetical protein [Pseudomonas frederiksbergensis]
MASTTQHPEFTLAVIGGGGTCVAFLHLSAPAARLASPLLAPTE